MFNEKLIQITNHFLYLRVTKTEKMIKLLVPVDLSEYSLYALKYAIKLGEKLPSEIILAHCFPEIVDESDLGIAPGTEVSDPQKLVKEERDREKKWLDDLKIKTEQELSPEQKQNITIKTRFEIGYAEDVLVVLSEDLKPDVIVMGTKSKDETIKELLGSVTSDIIKKARVPVLTIPADSEIDMDKISNILFVTDFSEVDYDSLHKLINLTSPFKTIIYSIQFNTVKPDKWDRKKLNEFRDYCAGTYRNHKIEADILYSENFLEDLDNFIKEKKIDIIAMTRKKRNLISALFHPSITRKILFHTNIPLLVFHA